MQALLQNYMKSMKESRKDLILVVDDVEQNVAVISQMLRNAGHMVIAAFNGEAALRMLEKRRPDLILLDVMMPGIDGFEVCRRIREKENLRDIPIIFLSALAEVDTKVRGLEAGGVDYITKPFQEQEVLARVQAQLRLRHLEIERQQHIEELRGLNEEKDRLMQIVSHDLRSPLGGIRGLAEILRDDQEEHNNPESVKEFSGIIVQTADKLLQLVNDLLDLARVESGKMPLNAEGFDLVNSIRQTLRMMEKVAANKGVALEFSSNKPSLFITADEPKLMQVINNLLSNAIKFTPQNGSVTITASAFGDDAKDVTITVKDTGLGIPQEYLPRIFDKFGPFQRSGTAGERGTGLGMSIIKRFVELHNGTITAESIPGSGSTFKIIIPLHPPAQQH
jgi:signal transduction histidine kinase